MMNRRELLKSLPALALTPFIQQEPPESTVSQTPELTNQELFDLIMQLSLVARGRELQLFNLINITRVRDMNLGTIDWNGEIYTTQEKDPPI